ncbi:6-carboxy-5,6,7,8-tetrahydropterin synthase [Candidatus Kinetoplastibacterium sorsogonicusi]|uniref:6-carboxy-5,6,7,8-tetrahydropterin synthase n=1 Tax=Candidatus Kinetoplastidibacterium kentomonadis TaxID=1576550 RepID=A0A3Q8EU27_9PROT|nr:6-carboxytetrahydropterin synthase QueD [Candidatus Kinetoplastibacterium sorsogonicusi]AWD32370.1 6-carboxy-5,6,7,8-tetrahydropterin synthase [Candidatus Kinetoplastibacterium sorsogonicusi]
MINVTKKLEFDAGHRIPHHKGKCNNLHGHRYILQITISGFLNDNFGESDYGMLIDFSNIKNIAQKYILDIWDHAFLVYEKDQLVLDFLKSIPNHKTVILSNVPTVENLAKEIYKILEPLYEKHFSNILFLKSITLYETPTCWSEYSK